MDKPSAELIQLAKYVFLAQAWEGTIREPIEKLQLEVLTKGQYKNANKDIMPGIDIITKLDDTWLLSDEDFKAYYKQCYDGYLKLGFTDLKYDYCPLLIAEHMTSDATNAMLDEASKITGVTPHQLMCAGAGLDLYKQAAELTLQMCAPYINKDEVLAELKTKKDDLSQMPPSLKRIEEIKARVKATKQAEKTPTGNHIFVCCEKCEHVYHTGTNNLTIPRKCPKCEHEMTVKRK